MHMLYNSASFIVVQFDVPVPALNVQDGSALDDELLLSRDGYEIVDKYAGKEIFIEGALAEQFKEGVEALIENDPSEDDLDDFIERFANLGQQPVVVH